MRRGDRVVGRDNQLGCLVLIDHQLVDTLVLNGETVGDLVVEGLQFEVLGRVGEHDDLPVRGETGHQESVVPCLLLPHVHEVPGFDGLEGRGNDRLAGATGLQLRGAVVEDDRSSVLRGIEVVEQVYVKEHQSLSILWFTTRLLIPLP